VAEVAGDGRVSWWWLLVVIPAAASFAFLACGLMRAAGTADERAGIK
jgi:hypothetical protein